MLEHAGHIERLVEQHGSDETAVDLNIMDDMCSA